MAYFNQFIPFIRPFYPPYLEWKGKEKDKIYLTFDDGPVPGVTEHVLDVLDQFKIKATFFCVGDNIKKHSEIFEKIIYNSHQVGNHTFNHLKGFQTPDAVYMENVEKCYQEMKPHMQDQPMLFRPPYGRAKKSQLKLLKDKYRIIMWNVLAGDFDATQSGEACLNEARRFTKGGDIVIFHDSYKAEKNLRYALPHYIESCLNKGFQFSTL